MDFLFQNGLLILNGLLIKSGLLIQNRILIRNRFLIQNENLIRIELVIPNGLLIQNGLFDRMDFWSKNFCGNFSDLCNYEFDNWLNRNPFQKLSGHPVHASKPCFSCSLSRIIYASCLRELIALKADNEKRALLRANMWEKCTMLKMT